MNPDSGARADIFLLPLAVADPNEIRALGLDPGVLSRRVPDFLHQIVNQGDAVPTGMVEIQSPGCEQPVTWVELRELPDADGAFDLLPDGYVARAVVLGRICVEGDALAVELRVHFAEDLDSCCSMTVAGSFSPHDPASSLTKLAERLARVLDVALPPLQHNLLTRNGAAFFAYLRGLDGAALLSGDLDVASSDRPEALLRPLADAVRLDPSFGLALRTWHATVALATANGRLDKEAWARLADACLGARPQDGEACVAIAEQLSVLGDQERATRWLQHAVDLSPPPPRGLESLGIVFANRGEIRAARDLWLAGLEQDGHPDFFAHLARLAFACGDPADAWEKVASGLRRIRERSTRLEEWGDDGRGSGVLLSYLLDHFAERKPPPSVVRGVRDLCSTLRSAEDRIELGLCLLELGALEEAQAEIGHGLAGELPCDVRDRGVRALLRLRVPDFEVRFAKAVDCVARQRVPRRALADLEGFRAIEPCFWLATFYAGVAHRRLGDEEAALDLMAEVIQQRPGQADALTVMAELFDRRGNPKRALECIDDALVARPTDTSLLGRRALYQHRLGRSGPARESLQAALVGGCSSPELDEIRRQILS